MNAVSFATNVIAKEAKMFRFNLFIAITTPILLMLAVLTIRLALSQSADRQQLDVAEAARRTGPAQLFAHADTGTDRQRADAAEAARWTGLALREFERMGDRRRLPQCITGYVIALLPGSADAAWRSMVPTCGQ